MMMMVIRSKEALQLLLHGLDDTGKPPYLLIEPSCFFLLQGRSMFCRRLWGGNHLLQSAIGIVTTCSQAQLVLIKFLIRHILYGEGAGYN